MLPNFGRLLRREEFAKLVENGGGEIGRGQKGRRDKLSNWR